jgi:hypothetical protein
LILSLFAVLACGDGNYTAGGDSTWACYSPQSAIYNADLNNAEPNAPSRSTAAVRTVTFIDNNSTVYEVQVSEGDIITLPDIRAKHCFHGREDQILLGWNDKSSDYLTTAFYKVTGDVAFTSVWAAGDEIYNAEELDGIRDDLTKTYKLMRNIDLKDYKTRPGWTPIGEVDDVNNFFTGKLYGNGYLIDSLTIDSDTASVAGLFGAIGGNAEIYDLKINLAEDGIKLTTEDTDKAVGALVGYIKYENGSEIIIKNIRTSDGKIIADNCSNSLDKHLYVGGLVGRVLKSTSFNPTGANPKVILDNLSNSVPVTVELNSACNAYLGGIIGGTDLTNATAMLISTENEGAINLTDPYSVGLSIRAGGFIGSGDNITVKAGTNRGAVYVSSTSTGAIAFAGGIAGRMDNGGKFENDNNTGDVTVFTVGSAYVGGLAGRMADVSVDNSSNNGLVSAVSSSSNAYSGGIAGWASNSSFKVTTSYNTRNIFATGKDTFSGGIAGNVSNGGTITSSYNTGDVIIPASSSSYAGGIAGNMSGGLVENVNNSGNVTAASTAALANSDAHSGGIAGYMGGSGSIKNSSNSGDVSSTITGPSSSHAGGIAGRILGGTIENDNNTGEVTAESDSTNAYSGGIAGRMSNNSKIENAHNYDNVSATSNSANAYSGGIAGYTNNSKIENAHNYDNVSATVTSSGNAYAGGIAGYMIGGGSVANSHNTDNVSAKASVDGQSFAGGIAGLVNDGSAEIKTSYNNGKIYAVSRRWSASGGIVGKMEDGGGTSLISNCYNTNYIYASSNNGNSDESFAGGIVGGLWYSKIENSYNIGDIETNIGGGNLYGGGIVADMVDSSSSVVNCAAINQNITSFNKGRIIGNNNGGIPKNNFAYSGMGIGTPGANSRNGTSKTLNELKDQSTYSDPIDGDGSGGLGWQFCYGASVPCDAAHPWKMPSGGGYPILYWQ